MKEKNNLPAPTKPVAIPTPPPQTESTKSDSDSELSTTPEFGPPMQWENEFLPTELPGVKELVLPTGGHIAVTSKPRSLLSAEELKLVDSIAEKKSEPKYVLQAFFKSAPTAPIPYEVCTLVPVSSTTKTEDEPKPDQKVISQLAKAIDNFHV